jgi:phosphatidylserine/phosphatidylglycerophosphate/cardiolipin synthase-like enzyme
MNNNHWTGGNRIELLENGEQFFPRVFEAIRQAKREVIVETFILFEDKVGTQLHAALREAAQNGAKVDLMIDGFGSPDLSREFIEGLTSVGVKVRVFDPGARFMGQRLNVFRRMHRKIVVIDGERAFVGGINYSADHLMDFGPKAKQDYAVALEGPIVAQIHQFVLRAIALGGKGAGWFRRRLKSAPPVAHSHAGEAEAMFVTRDNRRHTNDIERQYRAAIRSAKERIVIANAYFFPGYRLIKELRRAALAAARQGRADGRQVEHRGLEQPRPAEPVAQSGVERDRARQGLQRRAVGAHGPPHAQRLQAGGGGRPGQRMERLAAGAQLLRVPHPALVSGTAGPPAAPRAAPDAGRGHRPGGPARHRPEPTRRRRHADGSRLRRNAGSL